MKRTRINVRALEQRKIDRRIERAYQNGCAGIEIDIMHIPSIFHRGRAFLSAHPDADDLALGVAVRNYVNTIRK